MELPVLSRMNKVTLKVTSVVPVLPPASSLWSNEHGEERSWAGRRWSNCTETEATLTSLSKLLSSFGASFSDQTNLSFQSCHFSLHLFWTEFSLPNFSPRCWEHCLSIYQSILTKFLWAQQAEVEGMNFEKKKWLAIKCRAEKPIIRTIC